MPKRNLFPKFKQGGISCQYQEFLLTRICTRLTTHRTNSQQQQDPLQLLGQALQSGNLTAAQQAYNALIQNPATSGQTQNGQLAQDLSAIGQALKSGDLSSAQQAYSKLNGDMQTVGKTHHHHHHHRKVASSQDSTSASNSGSSSVSGGNSQSQPGDTISTLINVLT